MFTCVLARSSCWKPSTSLLSSAALSWTNHGTTIKPTSDHTRISPKVEYLGKEKVNVRPFLMFDYQETKTGTCSSPWGRWASCRSCWWGRWADLFWRETLPPSLAQSFPPRPGKQIFLFYHSWQIQTVSG